MPPKGKRNANKEHEKGRHEAGLAAPGKRISKDKPALVTNGHTNGKAVNSAPPPPLPSTGLNQGLTFPRPSSVPTEAPSHSSSQDQFDIVECEDKDASSTHAETEEEASKDMANTAHAHTTSSDSRCGPDSQTLKSITSQASSTLALAVTILKSCPLRDAVAIMILFLSLPPTLIITIHTLFASLTFVPPAAGLSWSSWTAFPSIGDWFHATPGGGPSPFTILIADVVTTLIYLLCPTYVQNVFMDLGQAVIAISLSGATAGKGGSTNSVAFCSAIICFSHVLRYKAFHFSGMDYLRSAVRHLGIDTSWQPTATATFAPRSPITHGWPRLLLGCHILAQGILTLLRRWIASANQARSSKKQDPEAVTLAEGAKVLSGAVDGNTETTLNGSTDGRPPGPSPAARDSKERVANSKKKRKQANQVRSQQPLWAAIASTKVTFLKEMEQKQASNDALEAGVADTSNATFAGTLLSEDRVWILDIHSTEVTFKAELSALSTDQDLSRVEDIVPPSPGIDKQKPFYVRLNGADWGSTRILGAASNGSADQQENRSWTGEIYGLTAMTKYSCEFVRLSDQQVICTTSLITLPAPSAEQTSTVPAPPQHQSLRPLSPTSTLKQSIAAAEIKREEIRNKLKRTRKDHKNAASAVRREIDQLNSKVASSGGQDERQKQRILQLKQHVKQAEDATVALKSELATLGEIPEDELEEHASKKHAWEIASDAKAAAAADFEKTKAEANKELSDLRAEIASSNQKRERLIARRSKLSEQYERLVSEQTANLSARQRHEQQRAMILQEHAETDSRFQFWITDSRANAEHYNIKANEMWQQINLTSTQIARQQAAISGPTTPEGDLPGTNGPHHRLASGFDFQKFNAPMNHGLSGQSWGGRGRSSSMLSGYSGFTDDLDIEQPQYVPDEQSRKRSNGSSGSAGSVGDQWSPRPATKTMSPIGPPSDDKGRGRSRMSAIGSHR